MKLFAQTCDRFQIPDGAAAALLHFYVTLKLSLLIDKSKVRCDRCKQRRALQSSDCALASQSMQDLYFESRKAKTLIQVTEQDGGLHQRTIRENYISIIREPESRFLVRATPGSGKAKEIASEILDLLSKKSVNTKQIVAIGCNSTAVNTGINGGVLRLLANHIKSQFTGLSACCI